MTFTFDPVYVTNLILCVIILVVACIGFNVKKNITALLIGIAFGLFGITHLLTLFGLKEALTAFFIAIRTLAYVSICLGLVWLALRR